jgi:hypothetical protein
MNSRRLLAHRIALGLVAALVLTTCVAPASNGAEPEPARTMVEVKFRVVKVATTKLRAVGFDWHEISGRESLRDGAKLGKFLRALAENNLAQTVAEPMIATVDGQPASLKVATRSLEVTPTVLENDRIRLAYRIATQIPTSGGPAAPFESASTTELKPGEPHLLSETRSLTYAADGKEQETTIYVVADAKVVTR